MPITYSFKAKIVTFMVIGMAKLWYGPFLIFFLQINGLFYLNLIFQFQLSMGNFSVEWDCGLWPHPILITAFIIYFQVLVLNYLSAICMF